MTKRKCVYVALKTPNGYTAKVYRDYETKEYVTRYYLHGITLLAWDYFTNDQDDAIYTAHAGLQAVSKQ